MKASNLVHFYHDPELLDAGRHSVPVHLTGTIVGHCRDSAWQSVESIIHNPELYELHKLKDGSYVATCYDPGGESCQQIQFSREDAKRGEEWMIASAAHDMLHFHIASLERDVRASRQFKAPLASSLWSHTSALSTIGGGPETSKVFFELQFPSLAHIPISELLQIRSHEADSFIAFRSALTAAARTMLTERNSEDPKAIANAIRLDVIEPELARLNLKLKSAQRAMRNKTIFSVALTTVATMCGLMLDGFAGAAGGAAVGMMVSGASSAASKFCDVEAEIEASDMFFLWKALGHAE